MLISRRVINYSYVRGVVVDELHVMREAEMCAGAEMMEAGMDVMMSGCASRQGPVMLMCLDWHSR
jgi:hypothetical protein